MTSDQAESQKQSNRMPVEVKDAVPGRASIALLTGQRSPGFALMIYQPTETKFASYPQHGYASAHKSSKIEGGSWCEARLYSGLLLRKRRLWPD